MPDKFGWIYIVLVLFLFWYRDREKLIMERLLVLADIIYLC